MLAVIILPFALLTVAFLTGWAGFGVRELVFLVVGHFVAGMGITLGYHRMLAHGAFKAPAPVRAVLLFVAAMALQGGPATWAATHRRHHAVSDKPGDPHSPVEGFWHAHFGWLPKGRLVNKGPAHRQMMQDPVVRFFERTVLYWMVLSIAGPALVAMAIWGPSAFVPVLLWGGFVRAGMVHHTTWAVNSVGHVWGARPLDTPDKSRNNVLLAFFSFGEGWHNNHHAEPRSAFIGHRWYQFDWGKYAIWTMARLGLVRDVVRPQSVQVRKAARMAARTERRARRSGASSS